MAAPSPATLHLLFEIAAYAVGMRLFLRERRRLRTPALADRDATLWIVVAAALGAALGSKLAFWFDDPLAAFADFPNWRHLLGGKTIVGGLLGGLVGVESAKALLGVRTSTGDTFVWPLAVGMAIGRIGCFLAGLDDHTYGVTTTLPWGVDFGDGIPRHPTQLYEIAFLLAWATLVQLASARLPLPGDRFRAFMIGYLAFRLLVDAIKPVLYAYWPGLSGIQWLCIAGLTYYARHAARLMRGLAWRTS